MIRSAISRLAKSSVFDAARRDFGTASSVGFVGLGRMGLPMAKNLAQSTSVVAFDTNLIACQEAADSGIRIVDSVRAVATESSGDVLITMLPGDQAFQQVMTEWQESLSLTDSSKCILNCSTVSPSTSKTWESIYRSEGHTVIDAPVSGGVKGATDGTLTFMVGCESEQDLEKAQPYLDVMGKRTVRCGKPGAGSATKLCVSVSSRSRRAVTKAIHESALTLESKRFF